MAVWSLLITAIFCLPQLSSHRSSVGMCDDSIRFTLPQINGGIVEYVGVISVVDVQCMLHRCASIAHSANIGSGVGGCHGARSGWLVRTQNPNVQLGIKVAFS